MPILNPNLIRQQFYDDAWVRQDDRRGFKHPPRVVTLTGPFRLYKLTGDQAPQHPIRGVVTAWWSAVDPYQEDTEGAIGRFKQAYMNGIDLSSMVRYMSAVKLEWNLLSNYVEISINVGDQVKCFWGEFASMPLTDLPRPLTRAQAETMQATSPGYEAAVLPDELGALRAWQFYVPGLTNAFIQGGAQRLVLNAHDMDVLGAHFRLNLGPASHLGAVSERLKNFQKDTRARMISYSRPNPTILEMYSLLPRMWNLEITPAEALRQFCNLGRAYLASNSNDPRAFKTKVQEYVTSAGRPM